MKKIKFAIFDESKNVLSEDILKTKFKTNEVWKMNLEETHPDWCPEIVCDLHAVLKRFFVNDMRLMQAGHCGIYVCGDSATSDRSLEKQQKCWFFYCNENVVEQYVPLLFHYAHAFNLMETMRVHAASLWSGHTQNQLDEAVLYESNFNHLKLLRDTLNLMDRQLKEAHKAYSDAMDSLISHTW